VNTTALDDLQAVMFQWKDQKSVVIPKLTCDGQGTGVRWWRVHLAETTDTIYTGNLDRCVGWTIEQLKDWPDCKRMSFDMWDFKHRKDAEKFITLFHLSWDQ
jgi:hypothetical protein